MKKIYTMLFLVVALSSYAQHKLEFLDRGLVAVKVNNGVYLSWRVLGTDPTDIGFNIYRDGMKVNSSVITGATNITDASGTVSSSYSVRSVLNGAEQSVGGSCGVWATNQLVVQLDRPTSSTCTYSPNDCSVGDVDGDGQWEIIVKWDPSNSQDNSLKGKTDKVYLDCYEFTGEKLWRIDLGLNIRAGAHYTQFLVGDYDVDGYAEVVCKTAPGTKGGDDQFLKKGPAANDDDGAVYRNSNGYILTGPEYLTIFNGRTGAEMSTITFNPERGSVSSWGDSYGNRVDRFLASNAYLDGQKPSIVYNRGYYTRMAVTAWDWDGTSLKQRWYYNAPTKGQGGYGQGNHNWSVADVDGDGKDEIIHGNCAIDDNGTLMYRMGYGHGDAIHVGDMDLDNPGLEVWEVFEDKLDYGFGLHDAKTGKTLWGVKTGTDVGRGVAADVDANSPGYEMWSSANSNTYSSKGKILATRRPSYNFRVYWDGDLQDELLDGNKLDKWNGNGSDRLVTFEGNSCNTTKATPNLSADIIGDWREEVILHDGASKLYVYTTTIPTTHKLYTLMHNPAYRNAISWQNTAYNQPPHLDFFLGYGADKAPKPNIELVMDAFSIKPEVKMTAPTSNITIPFMGSVTLSATATDADGHIVDVSFYAGSLFIGSTSSAPYSLKWSNVPTGIHQVTAIATDNMGASSTSLPVTVTGNPGTLIYQENTDKQWSTVGNWIPSAIPATNDTAIIQTGECQIKYDIPTLVRIEPNGTLRMIGYYSVPNIELQGGKLSVTTSNTSYGLDANITVEQASSISAGSAPASIFTIDGSLEGSASLTKSGVAILALNADASAFTGDWNITDGVFKIGSNKSIGNNIVSVSNGAKIDIAAENIFISKIDLADGTINIPFDITVREFEIAGISLKAGVYTAADYPNAITGTATLTVLGTIDCAGVEYGNAYYDKCGICSSGTTGRDACAQDCNGDWGGTAFIDNCDVCSGGNTGLVACSSSAEAEGACSFDGTVDSNNEGFSGEGFVNFANASGSSATFNLYAQKSGAHSFTIIYANGGSVNRPMTLTVNGTNVTVDFSPSGSWTTWIDQTVTVSLQAGVNQCTLKAQGADGGPNVDRFIFMSDDLGFGSCTADCNGTIGGIASIDMCGVCSGGNTGMVPCEPQIAEAEDISCSFDGAINANDAGAGFSGTGFINGENAAETSVSFNIYAPTATEYTLGVRYANGGTADRPSKVLVNGAEAVSSFSMPVTAWSDYQYSSTEIPLKQGINEITLTALSADGLANLDYYYIVGDATFAGCETTQTIDLVDGWNLVSLYVVPSDSQIGLVLPNAGVVKSQDGFYNANQPAYLNSLMSIEPGAGYLVRNAGAETILVTGIPVENQMPVLKSGWNLVGVPSADAVQLSQYPSAVIIKDFTEFYENGNQQSSITELKPGKAYFIK